MMDQVIFAMLEQYTCVSDDDYENALKQIMQQIALLGLWRAKFYEHAAFYGGSALRILYQLNRFSEDLDFSLLHPHREFSLTPYNHAICEELRAFGFEVEVKTKVKQTEVKTLLQPIPFSVKTYVQPDLFAGKVHALLCRPWKVRVKERDWYDFIW